MRARPGQSRIDAAFLGCIEDVAPILALDAVEDGDVQYHGGPYQGHTHAEIADAILRDMGNCAANILDCEGEMARLTRADLLDGQADRMRTAAGALRDLRAGGKWEKSE